MPWCQADEGAAGGARPDAGPLGRATGSAGGADAPAGSSDNSDNSDEEEGGHPPRPEGQGGRKRRHFPKGARRDYMILRGVATGDGDAYCFYCLRACRPKSGAGGGAADADPAERERRRGEQEEKDHILPCSHDGSNGDIANMCLMHRQCNIARSNTPFMTIPGVLALERLLRKADSSDGTPAQKEVVAWLRDQEVPTQATVATTARARLATEKAAAVAGTSGGGAGAGAARGAGAGTGGAGGTGGGASGSGTNNGGDSLDGEQDPLSDHDEEDPDAAAVTALPNGQPRPPGPRGLRLPPGPGPGLRLNTAAYDEAHPLNGARVAARELAALGRWTKQ